jgi:tetratricopeptide (TPR) repeat protein
MVAGTAPRGIMADSSSDNPFAEFAAPKTGPADRLRIRREQQRRARREHWLLLGILVGSVTVATAGAAGISAGTRVLPAALGLGGAGTVLGMAAGWLIGVITWSYVLLRAKGPFNPMDVVGLTGRELIRENSWDTMTVWLSVWQVLGIAGGGAWGASSGAALAARAAPDSLQLWAWGGTLVGLTVGFGIWLVLRRVLRRAVNAQLQLQQAATAYLLENQENSALRPEPELEDGLPGLSEPGKVQLPERLRLRKEKRPWMLVIGLIALVSVVIGAVLWFGVALFENTLRANRLNPEAIPHNERGILRARAGDLDSAIADFTKAIELEPRFAEAYCHRGDARERKGDLDGAIADLTIALALDAGYRRSAAEAYNTRGHDRDQQGDINGAIADYSKAIEIDPAFAAAYYNRGGVRSEQNDLDGAIADYSKAIELDSLFALPYNNRGYARDQKGDLKGAIADYTKAIQLDPRLAESYLNRGLAQVHQGNDAEAQNDFDQYLKLRPGKEAELAEQIKLAKEKRAKQ